MHIYFQFYKLPYGDASKNGLDPQPAQNECGTKTPVLWIGNDFFSDPDPTLQLVSDPT
jgi:hypothetical protein